MAYLFGANDKFIKGASASGLIFGLWTVPGIQINGAENGVANATPGLLRRKYNAYNNDDVTWMATQTPIESGADTSVTTNNIGDNYSLQWTGYFTPPATGDYELAISSDDGSMLWLGTNATTDFFNSSNMLINNGGLHGTVKVKSRTVRLESGAYYPIRIQYGEMDGGDVFFMQYRLSGQTAWTNLNANDVWYNPASAEGFN